MNDKLLKYLIYLALVSIIFGPIGAIPLGIPQVNIYFTDIIIGLICLVWLSQIRQLIKLLRTDKTAKYFCVFAGIAAISLIFSPINLDFNEKFISGLYLARIFAYFFVYLTVKTLIKEKALTGTLVTKLLVIAGIIISVLGWLQYFLYPNLRNLYYLGWDLHFHRIFSTFLDPNYFGLIMGLTLIILLFSEKFTRKVSLRNTLSVFVFITLLFTYSRSSFLAFAGAAGYYALSLKKFRILAAFIVFFGVSLLFLPRPGGAGVQLERVFSAQTRVENWQQAFKLFTDHPLLGVGFNTIRYAKKEYKLPQDNLSQNHAGAGFDNSFLFIAATTGAAGLFSYLFFLRRIFQKTNLWVKTSLVAIIIHSFFLNSLFFPWVMVWMWILLATGPVAHVSQRYDTSSVETPRSRHPLQR